MNFSDFMPHRWCMANDPLLLTLFFASDMTVFLCYMVLAGILVAFSIAKRGEFIAKFHALFAVFIFCCGLTHALQALTLYYPIYWVEVSVISLTALVSVAAVVLVLKNYVHLRDLPRRSTLEKNLKEQANTIRAMQAKFSEKLTQVRHYRDLHKEMRKAH